ncbi:MAG: hypothetical protein J6A97_03380 [Clostridia bacterium]|nr:hypothetical protein [Clostridia bacterium]
MNDYTYQDMMRMQSEAKQRVLEMQKRSRNAADSFNGTQKTNVSAKNEPTEELPRIPKKISYPAELHNGYPNRTVQKKTPAGQGLDIRKSLQSVFGNLSGDDYEKMFILSLCLLLTKDGADESLIMALMYLLV